MLTTTAWQRTVFFAVALAAIVMTALGWYVSNAIQLALLALAVALFGIPHGALDPLVARTFGWWSSAKGLALFLTGYGLLAIGVLFVWRAQPAVALGAFLILSVVHFASDWPELRWWQRGSVALAVVSVPALAAPESVATIFAVLTAPPSAAILVDLLSLAAWPALASLVFTAITVMPRQPLLGIEVGLLAVLALLLPPLVFFVVYFCALHSPRHLIDTIAGLPAAIRPSVLPVAAAITATTVAAGAAAGAMLSAPVDATVLRVVFIGLAALTVPHVLLIAAQHPPWRKVRAFEIASSK